MVYTLLEHHSTAGKKLESRFFTLQFNNQGNAKMLTQS